MFTFHCQCGKKLAVRDNWAGKRVKCPQCGNSVVATPEAVAMGDQTPVDPRSAAVQWSPEPPSQSPVPGMQAMGPPPLSTAPSPLSYANADLPRKGGLAPTGNAPVGRPRNVVWFLLVSIGWLVINLLFYASFHYDLNGSNPNFARPLLLVLAWFVTGAGVLASWLILVYAVHKDVGNLTAGGYDISPAKAVGFSFIPGFSAFWAVYMPSRLAGELNRQLRATGRTAPAGPIVALQVASIPLGLLVPALVPILYSITMIRIQKALNQIWLSAQAAPATAPDPGPEAMIIDPV
jgi:hypothetical protein